MARRKTWLVLAVTLLAGILWAPVQAQQTGPVLTKEHGMLKRDAGTWDCECKFFEQPNAPPQVSKALERSRVIGDGLWLISDFEGEFGGQKFWGHGLTGYDSLKKKFVGTWIDSMSPHLYTMEGTYDDKTATMTTTMEGVEPASGQTLKMRNVTKYIDDNTRVFTMFAPGADGKEVPTMEITYKRRVEK